MPASWREDRQLLVALLIAFCSTLAFANGRRGCHYGTLPGYMQGGWFDFNAFSPGDCWRIDEAAPGGCQLDNLLKGQHQPGDKPWARVLLLGDSVDAYMLEVNLVLSTWMKVCGLADASHNSSLVHVDVSADNGMKTGVGALHTDCHNVV
jgi:hypothetical protein